VATTFADFQGGTDPVLARVLEEIG